MHPGCALAILVGAVLLMGCGNEYHPEYHPQSAYSYEQNVSYPTTVWENAVTTNAAPTQTTKVPLPQPPNGHRVDPANVLILQTTHLDRPAEVIGVIDTHMPMGQHDSALQVLRQRAAAMGADAVVGVEFHHGEAEGEPTHLSGLAVRFL